MSPLSKAEFEAMLARPVGEMTPDELNRLRFTLSTRHWPQGQPQPTLAEIAESWAN